jgi:hypothetical protein
MEASWSFNSDIDMSGFNSPNEIDALSFAMDIFIDALVDDISRYHEFTHFVNDHSNFYDQYNSTRMELFDFSMLPRGESGVQVTDAYIIDKLFDMNNYLLTPPVNYQRGKEEQTQKQGSGIGKEFVLVRHHSQVNFGAQFAGRRSIQ